MLNFFRQHSNNIKILIQIIIGLYLFINIEIVLWYLIDPENFWGYVWFYAISAFGFYGFFLFGNAIEEIRHWYKTGSFRLKRALVLLLLNAIVLLLYVGVPALISKSINDKYRYVTQSENLFSEGRYDKALVNAQKVYEKSKVIHEESPVLFIPYLYNEYYYSSRKFAINKYQATLNLALCHFSTGKEISLSDSLYRTCIDICTTEIKDSNYLVPPVIGLARLHLASGKDELAEDYLHQISSLYKKIEKSDISRIKDVFLLNAMFSQKHGDYARAFSYVLEANKVYESSGLSKESSVYLQLQTLLAHSYLDLNDIENAWITIWNTEKFAEDHRSKAVYREYLKSKARLFIQLSLIQIDTSNSRNRDWLRRVWFFRVMEKDKIPDFGLMAEKVIQTLVDELKSKPGPAHIDYAISLKYYADYLIFQSEYDRAVKLIDKALIIAKKNKSSFEQVYASILFTHALCNYLAENKLQSIRSLNNYENFIIDKLNESFSFMTESERESFIQSFNANFETINTIRLSSGNDSDLSKIYNTILAYKSAALFSNQSFVNTILKTEDDQLMQKYIILSKGKAELENLRLSESINKDYLMRFEDSIKWVEKELLDIAKRLKKGNIYQLNSYSWRDVRNNLKDGEVAIEIIRVPEQLVGKTDYFYYALMLSATSEYPELIKLCKESRLKNLMIREGDVAEKINSMYTGRSLEELKRLLWKPMISNIPASSQIYLSVTGILNNISYPALSIIEDYRISMLSSTKLIASKKSNKGRVDSVHKNALLFGDINYNFNAPRKGSRSLNMSKIRSGFNNLKGTAKEIDTISNMLTHSDWKPYVYRGEKATELSFRSSISQAPNIVHMATHGFYYPVDQKNDVKEFFNVLNHSLEVNNPLFRSGLVLAVADDEQQYNMSSDGILTAFEVSKLNLTSVDLAVLSACETGLGDIKGYEGVYGLQRGFKMAGVDKIIISLWKVPDEKTAELMQFFYQYYLDFENENLALKLAQKEMNLKYQNQPFLWAGFTLIE